MLTYDQAVAQLLSRAGSWTLQELRDLVAQIDVTHIDGTTAVFHSGELGVVKHPIL